MKLQVYNFSQNTYYSLYVYVTKSADFYEIVKK